MINCRKQHGFPGTFWKSMLWGAITLMMALLSACQTTATATPAATATATLLPTPTPIPLGQPGNPVIFAFVDENPGAPLKPEMNELANALSAQTGYSVQAQNFADDAAVIQAMQNGKAHIAWFQPITYIYAREKNLADAALLSNHYGVYFYGSQVLANIESGFYMYFDPISNQNAADAATALQQLDGKRPCWVDSKSLSGYILVASLLKENGINVLPGVETQTHTAAVRALYIKGICDFAVTFALSGDPRTSPSVLADLTDARERIPILWRSEPVIPNLNLAFRSTLPDEIRSSLTTAMLDIIHTDTGKSVVSAALNYDIQDLRVVDDSIYDPIRAALHTLDMAPDDMLGR